MWGRAVLGCCRLDKCLATDGDTAPRHHTTHFLQGDIPLHRTTHQLILYTSIVLGILCLMLVLPTLKSADMMRTSLYLSYLHDKVQNWSFCCRKSWFYFNDNSTRKYFDSFLIFYREKVDKKFCCQSSWVCPHSEHVEMPLSRQEKIFMESQFLTPFQSDILVICRFVYITC